MSINFPFYDILKDGLRQFPNKPITIITDLLLPVTLFFTGSGKPKEFHIFTTSVADCRELGSNQWRYQRPSGFMCHGETKIAVKEPYIGQPMWFNTHPTLQSTFSGQRVLRIYNQRLEDVIANPWTQLRSIMEQLAANNNAVDFSNMLVTTLFENSYNSFFLHLLSRATQLIKWDGSAFARDDTPSIHRLIKSYRINLDVVYDSGFIIHEDGKFIISDALFYLFVEAIHQAKPMATQLDKNGLLRLT